MTQLRRKVSEGVITTVRMSVFRWPLQELPIAVVGTPVSKAKKSPLSSILKGG